MLQDAARSTLRVQSSSISSVPSWKLTRKGSKVVTRERPEGFTRGRGEGGASNAERKEPSESDVEDEPLRDSIAGGGTMRRSRAIEAIVGLVNEPGIGGSKLRGDEEIDVEIFGGGLQRGCTVEAASAEFELSEPEPVRIGEEIEYVAEGSGEPDVERFPKERRVREGRLSRNARGDGSPDDEGEDGDFGAGEVSPERRPGKERNGVERRLVRGVEGEFPKVGNSIASAMPEGRGVLSEGDAMTGDVCKLNGAMFLSNSELGTEGRDNGASSAGVEGPRDSAEEKAPIGKETVSNGVL